jgi:hypothetical protein
MRRKVARLEKSTGKMFRGIMRQEQGKVVQFRQVKRPCSGRSPGDRASEHTAQGSSEDPNSKGTGGGAL